MENLTLQGQLPLRFAQVMLRLGLGVFSGYLVIGICLGVLPAYIHNVLGYNNIIVGIAIGLQSVATLATRHLAGTITDTRGCRAGVMRGVVITCCAGLAYVLAGLWQAGTISLLLLMTARILSGVGESFLITGALAWGIGLTGPGNTGRIMSWNGIAMYAGLAAGAPLGITLQQHSGAGAVFLCTAVLPALGGLALLSLPALAPQGGHQRRLPFYKVLGQVWQPGTALALSAVAFGCISSFISLFFIQQHWEGASLAFLCFGGCYIGVRLLFASLPDKYGGARVAFISLLVEAAGQLLLCLAASPLAAVLGAALTGIGFSLVFPSLGVAALRHAQPQHRGIALGAFVAFFDVALGITGPLAGWIANHFAYQQVYILGALGTLLSAVIILTGIRKAG